MSSREGNSVDFGAEVSRIVRKIESSNPDIPASARVQKAWQIIADEHTLEHTDAVFVVPGSAGEEVVVYVDSQIWATELNLQCELLRMRINLEVQKMLEAQGRVRRVDEESALFGYEQAEHVKRLQFVPSKKKYSKAYQREMQENLEDIGREHVEPVALDDVELADLYVRTASIQDERVRKAAFDAAKAGLEIEKGRSGESQ